MTPLKIAINGFGRIGRTLVRAYVLNPNKFAMLNIVAINDIAQRQTLLHLLKFDSTHGRLSNYGVVASLDGDVLTITKDHRQLASIRLFCEPNPQKLPWGEMGVDVVLECTGRFRSYEQANLHRNAGAGQVIIGAAPFDNVDASIVMGVNDHLLTRQLPIISGVSCTTQALVPLLATLDTFGLSSVMMTEIHAVTADQTVLDQAHRDLRRARASGHNIIPTTSSSINATERVLPQLKGKLSGYSIRVPTINVACIDVAVVFERTVELFQIQQLLQQACQTTLLGIMQYCQEPLVSSDFVGEPYSLIVDSYQLMQAGEQSKIVAWYDNEVGYANRLLEMCLGIYHSC